MWKITKDNIDGTTNVGRTSADFDAEAWEKAEKAEKTKFRLLDDDGDVYFYGEYDGVNESENRAFAPLDEWGAAFGCTELQYKEGAAWKTL